MQLFQYIIVAILLVVIEILYIPLAKRLKIGNEVTPRSSHYEFQIIGGGIIFYISSLLFYIMQNNSLPPNFNLMIVGATILALISFYDDIKSSAPWLRLLIHIIVVAVTFSQILFNGNYDIYLLILICGVGFINAFNFMDGINGMLVGYTLVTLATIYYCINKYSTCVTNLNSFVIVLIIATIVFGIFNFRKKALCFSGDIGSIVMGFFILYLMIELILMTSNASMIVFLIVYAVDSVFTIFQRLFAGENIFTAHRLHLYQILANQCNIPHYRIAILYSTIQLFINIGYIVISPELKWSYFIIITTILTIVYFAIKRTMKNKIVNT